MDGGASIWVVSLILVLTLYLLISEKLRVDLTALGIMGSVRNHVGERGVVDGLQPLVRNAGERGAHEDSSRVVAGGDHLVVGPCSGFVVDVPVLERGLGGRGSLDETMTHQPLGLLEPDDQGVPMDEQAVGGGCDAHACVEEHSHRLAQLGISSVSADRSCSTVSANHIARSGSCSRSARRATSR